MITEFFRKIFSFFSRPKWKTVDLDKDVLSMDELTELFKDCHCRGVCGGRPLVSIHTYDHDGGIPVKGYREKQWVYFECSDPDCNYGTSWTKCVSQTNAFHQRKPQQFFCDGINTLTDPVGNELFPRDHHPILSKPTKKDRNRCPKCDKRMETYQNLNVKFLLGNDLCTEKLTRRNIIRMVI